MAHRFKAPKKIGYCPPKRMDPVKAFYIKLARDIHNEAQLAVYVAKCPAYDRDNFVRGIAPYLQFVPAALMAPRPVEA